MWQFILSPIGDLLQGHLILGGLGGVIAAVAGGIVSVIAWRSAKRNTARPATSPEAPPIHRSPAPPISYGEPAPPTSPARRLHPGPISLSSPTPRPEPKSDETDTGANLFNPDLFSAAPAPEATFTAPIWHTRDVIAAQTRAQQPTSLEHDLLPTPIWTTSLSRAKRRPTLVDETPLLIESSAPEIAAPVWSASLLGGRRSLVGAETPDALDVAAQSIAAQTMVAPIWTTPTRSAEAPATETAYVAADASEAADEIEPPIWPRAQRSTQG